MKKVMMHALIGLGLTCFLPSCSVLNGAAGVTRSVLAVPMGVVRGITDATSVQERLFEQVPETTLDSIPEAWVDPFDTPWDANHIAAVDLTDYLGEMHS